MIARTPSDHAVVAALCEALTPYSWRRFTPELLARFALAVCDRQDLSEVLSGLQGTDVGNWERLEPTDRCDSRVAQIVGFLTDLRWAEATLLATCATLASVLGPEPG